MRVAMVKERIGMIILGRAAVTVRVVLSRGIGEGLRVAADVGIRVHAGQALQWHLKTSTKA